MLPFLSFLKRLTMFQSIVFSQIVLPLLTFQLFSYYYQFVDLPSFFLTLIAGYTLSDHERLLPTAAPWPAAASRSSQQTLTLLLTTMLRTLLIFASTRQFFHRVEVMTVVVKVVTRKRLLPFLRLAAQPPQDDHEHDGVLLARHTCRSCHARNFLNDDVLTQENLIDLAWYHRERSFVLRAFQISSSTLRLHAGSPAKIERWKESMREEGMRERRHEGAKSGSQSMIKYGVAEEYHHCHKEKEKRQKNNDTTRTANSCRAISSSEICW